MYHNHTFGKNVTSSVAALTLNFNRYRSHCFLIRNSVVTAPISIITAHTLAANVNTIDTKFESEYL